MKNIEIKEMTAEQRLTHAIMLLHSYRDLFVQDVVHGYDGSSWVKELRTAYKIAKNMMVMRGIKNMNFYLKI